MQKLLSLVSRYVLSISRDAVWLGEGVAGWMKAVLLFWSGWHGVPNYGDAACLTSEAKHLMGGGGGRTGSRSWVGEATAVHRCSCVLSRCSTSPPSNWQMALDVRWFNGPRVFFFLPQSAISRDICNELARHTAESGSWERHFLMGGSAILTDLGSNQSSLSYCFWVMIIETSPFKLSAPERKAMRHHLILFTSVTLQRIKHHSIIGYQPCDRPFLTLSTPEPDVS